MMLPNNNETIMILIVTGVLAVFFSCYIGV